MDLFESANKQQNLGKRPLAERLRPKQFSEILGQDAFKEDGVLKKLFDAKKLPSLILWGPPGTGKTSFARLLAENYGVPFQAVNAIASGAKELKSIGEAAKDHFMQFAEQTLLFVDEIHRFNKSQQDVLLPFVESGDILLVGATTENPSFEINSALLSRSRVVKFQGLDKDSLAKLVERAMAEFDLKTEALLSKESFSALVELANSDARKLLNLCDQLIQFYLATKAGAESSVDWPCTKESLSELLPAMDLYFDRGDAHYDLASALIKSIRSSDADAAVYYLARMLEGGEDPNFVARRLVISASEDVGNADPKAIGVATQCMQALQFVGMPEGGIILAQATTYLASAPKSNRSYMSYKEALREVRSSGNLEVPMHLRNAPTKMMKEMGYGKDYQYAHSSDDGGVSHFNLPEEIKEKRFYEPLDKYYEKHISEYLNYHRQLKK